MAADKKSQYGVIEGTFVYAKVAQPDNKYKSDEKEWSIEVIVNEDVADNWDETFKKQPAKKIKASEFEAKYKIALPEHLKGEKNVYGIKLKRAATDNGEPVDEKFRPKVFLDDDNGDRLEIGLSRLIANGSYGKVSYYISDNEFGTFARLQNVLMDTKGFKEYVSSGGSGGAAGSEFGEVKPVKVEPAKESATKARPEKKAEKPAPVEQEDDGSDAPF